MNRNNRFRNNNRQGSHSFRNEPKKIPAASVPENFIYDDQDFPSLSADSAVSTKFDPKPSIQEKPPEAADNQQRTSDPSEKLPSAVSVSKKRSSAWKKPSETMQSVPSVNLMFDYGTKNKHSTMHNSVVQSETRPMTAREDEIDTKICEIILNIHLRHEYVSLERVEKDLFEYYGVQSFEDLRVNQRNLKTLTNLIHRIKDATFYMQIFEQIFNLCTLHDLDSLLAKFLKVATYEDAHLGPLSEHPEVQRVFEYKSRKRHQPIPAITSGQVISSFLTFRERYGPNERYDYKEFRNQLVQENQLHKQEELGLYCKSFRYLTEVSGRVTRDSNQYKKQAEKDAQNRIIRTIETQLREIQHEVQDKLDASLYVNKSPIAVFDQLISIVDKHLSIPQQKLVRNTLMKIRESELLRCLLNISIYLGTIEEPEKFIDELQKLNYQKEEGNEKQTSTSSAHTKTKSKHTVRQEQQMINMQNSTTTIDLTRPSIETSFGNRPHVPLIQICSEIFKNLARYDTVLTLKQLFDVKKSLCNQYSLNDFIEFDFYDSNDENIPLDLIFFLNIHHDKIDPDRELSIYENSSSLGDRHELYLFVNQLTIMNNWREKQQNDQQSTTREIPLTKDQLSAVEKALQHKFHGTFTNTRVSQIIKKSKKQFHKKTHSIIHFEESLLDEVNLSRLGICPPSLLVDESQLCEIILQCPIMEDLSTWLQWSHFFQSRYGSLKIFLTRKEQELDRLLLLETSNHELLRLPIDSSHEQFQKELYNGNIRLSVGHLCSLIICEYVQINRLPLSIYRQILTTWFIHLRSSAQLGYNQKEAMQYILEFLIYLPELIAQSHIIQGLILDPLDEVFGENEEMNARERIWILAHGKEKEKLELLGYKLDIDEWKNETKWKGIGKLEKESNIQQIENESYKKQMFIPDNTIPAKVQLVSLVTVPVSSSVIEPPSPLKSNLNINDSNSSSAAFEHIKEIRKNLGVDNDLDAAGQSIVNNLTEALAGTLEKLSSDLYSEQGHFVLELIQNADDNHYSSNCLPTLRFVVSSDRILVCNNEIGFQPKNVTAICTVCKSTKSKHEKGYTGHKGIGFKSVFMISHRPEIHSGDYHFCFDTFEGKDKFGYIRPIWLEQSEEILPSTRDWTTCIRLPIRSDKRGDGSRRSFDDIHARLLLFLNRVRQIEITREKHTRIFTRIDHAQGQIIELQEQITTTSDTILRSFWLVVKKISEVPSNIKMYLTDVKCSVQSTTIAIAYPLNAIHEASSYTVLQPQPVFAYLPLRSYGFRFILQGDFEIPANREEILRDNIWNDWLKNEMAQLLPVAYDLFKNLPHLLTTCSIDVQKHIGSLNSIETLKYFIKMIPTRNEIDPYFNSFIDKTIKGLMGSIRLPITNENNQEILQWVLPNECVFVRDRFIRQIFTSDLLFSHFNSYYLNEQFVHECDESILIKLGCRRLDFSSILKLIKTLYTQNNQEHSTKTTSIEQIAQWLLCIDYSLQQEREKPSFNFDDREQNETTTIDQLKQMKIIPLQQQTRLVSIDEMKEQAIVFPVEQSKEFAKYLQLVAEDLPTIDEKLMKYIEDKYPRRLDSIKSLLKNLGISEFKNVRRIYTNHILPIMSDDMQWPTKSDIVLIAYLILIYKDLYSPNPAHFVNEMEKLKSKLIVKTRQGNFVRININENNIIHLTSFYGSQTSLDSLKLFPNRFTFISDDYLNQYQKDLFYHDRERQRFNYFLNELDIHGFFLIKKVNKGFINTEQLVNSPWSSEIATLSSLIFEPFIIQDSCSPELETIITSKDTLSIDQYIEVLRYLNYTYRHFRSYYVASVIRSRDQHTGDISPVAGVASSFCLSLRKHSWIPISDGKLYKPSDVYYLPMDNPFRRYVPCLDASELSLTDMNFAQVLGFQFEVSSMTMFELLMKWSCNLDHDTLWKLIDISDEQDSNTIPCMISSTPRQLYHNTIVNMQTIYLFISQDEKIRLLLARFRLWPLIFIPRTNDTGEFLFVDEVFWQDPLAVFINDNDKTNESQQRIAIQPYYQNHNFFEQFFLNIFQIKQGPTLNDYLSLLNNIQHKTLDYIWKCVQVITQLAFANNKQTFVREATINWSFIPCLNNGNQSVKYTDRPYYPHDITIANLFSDAIQIIQLPDEFINSVEFKQQFCALFQIDDLANVIKILVAADNEQIATDLHEFYSYSVELIQDYLINNEFLSETRSIYLQSIFSEMSFLSVDCIHLSYQYNENIIRKDPSSSTLNCYIDETSRKFFILQKFENNEKCHINTIVNYLVEDPSARLKLYQFIHNLYQIYQNNGVEHLVKQQKSISEHNLSKWIIPQIKKKELNLSSMEAKEEENEINNDEIIITSEMLEKLKNEPGWQMKKPSTRILIDPNEDNSVTCFPSTANAIRTDQSLDTKPPSKFNLHLSDAIRKPEKTINDNTDSSISNFDGDSRNESKNHLLSEINTNEKATERSNTFHTTSFKLTDLVSTLATNNFEHIRISNFAEIALAPTTLTDQLSTVNSNTSSSENDAITGRRGEDFVYRYLLWKYPDAQIQWMNQEQESGQPFDIQLIPKDNNKQKEFIEVKTTRVPKQNTFKISISEVECLLQYQNNYYIYRVYYNESHEKLSTITILNQIKCHLQQKQMALSLTITEQLDEQ